MEEIRRRLMRESVIGGVVDDFHPLMKFWPLYGEKQIDLGDEVSADDVKSAPKYLAYDDTNITPQEHEIFQQSILVWVMTEPHDVLPGIQHLHWLITDIVVVGRDDGLDPPRQCLFTYEPPRGNRTRKMVFTLFKQNAGQPITRPISRDNFSTRDFAQMNSLGPPLFAGFFYVKDENENGNMGTSSTRPHENGHIASSFTWHENGNMGTSSTRPHENGHIASSFTWHENGNI